MQRNIIQRYYWFNQQTGNKNQKGEEADMTNYERIKQMSVEEMASYCCIGGLPICPLHAPHCKDDKCPECFKKWLESEVEE